MVTQFGGDAQFVGCTLEFVNLPVLFLVVVVTVEH
jgi:hypothetical protein